MALRPYGGRPAVVATAAIGHSRELELPGRLASGKPNGTISQLAPAVHLNGPLAPYFATLS